MLAAGPATTSLNTTLFRAGSSMAGSLSARRVTRYDGETSTKHTEATVSVVVGRPDAACVFASQQSASPSYVDWVRADAV